MLVINLFFSFLNGWLMVYFLEEDFTSFLGWINALAFALNIIPVIGKLLS